MQFFQARAFCVAMAVVCVATASCVTTTRTEIQSRHQTDSEPVRSVAVVSHVARVDAAWAGAFAAGIRSQLEAIGVRAIVQTRDPLELEADRSAHAMDLMAHSPEAVLVVVPAEGTVDSAGRHLARQFNVGLYRHRDDGSHPHDLLWRAKILLKPAGFYIAAEDMETLARDVIARLRADGMMRRTAAAGRPAGSPAPPRRSGIAPLGR